MITTTEDLASPRTSKTYAFLPWLFLAWGVYAVAGMVAPIDPVGSARYDLSPTEIYLIRISFQIPILILWGALFYGTFRFWQYTKSISGSPEASGFHAIGLGLSVLIAGLVLPSYVGLLEAYFPNEENIQRIVTTVNLYSSIGFSFIAFIFFLVGGKRLITLIPEHFLVSKAVVISGVTGVFFAGIYAFFLFNNPDRLVPTTEGVTRPAYYLGSDFWILVGVVMPYIIVWIVGLLSVSYLRHFSRFVHGVVYQKAFRAIARGVTSLVLLSVGLQILAQTGAFFAHTSLATILIIIYALLAAIAVGYLFIAQGARELGKLESA